ncbi:hypothetical protein EI94DRAFT_1705468 [Lactarius quietus]|nr:hypothetical protein EI94DRAFT_1705468 [Lactarius quietus]
MLLEKMKEVVEGMQRRRSLQPEAISILNKTEICDEDMVLEEETPKDDELTVEDQCPPQVDFSAPVHSFPATPQMSDLRHVFSEKHAAGMPTPYAGVCELFKAENARNPETPHLDGVSKMFFVPDGKNQAPQSSKVSTRCLACWAEQRKCARGYCSGSNAPPKASGAAAKTRIRGGRETPTDASHLADSELTPDDPPVKPSKHSANAPKGSIVRQTTRRAEAEAKEETAPAPTKSSSKPTRKTPRGMKAPATTAPDPEPEPEPEPVKSIRRGARRGQQADVGVAPTTKRRTAKSKADDASDASARDDPAEPEAPLLASRPRRGKGKSAEPEDGSTGTQRAMQSKRTPAATAKVRATASSAKSARGVLEKEKENTPERVHVKEEDEMQQQQQQPPVAVAVKGVWTRKATSAAQRAAHSEPERDVDTVKARARAPRMRAASGRKFIATLLWRLSFPCAAKAAKTIDSFAIGVLGKRKQFQASASQGSLGALPNRTGDHKVLLGDLTLGQRTGPYPYFDIRRYIIVSEVAERRKKAALRALLSVVDMMEKVDLVTVTSNLKLVLCLGDMIVSQTLDKVMLTVTEALGLIYSTYSRLSAYDSNFSFACLLIASNRDTCFQTLRSKRQDVMALTEKLRSMKEELTAAFLLEIGRNVNKASDEHEEDCLQRLLSPNGSQCHGKGPCLAETRVQVLSDLYAWCILLWRAGYSGCMVLQDAEGALFQFHRGSKMRIGWQAHSSASRRDEEGDKIRDLTTFFELVLKKPLLEYKKGNSPAPASFMIVIVALEECNDSAVVANAPWLKLIVNSRDRPQIRRPFDGAGILKK